MSQELFEKTPIQDLLIYRPRIFRDERGYFTESFNQKHFESMGIERPFVQDNRSLSKKGTLRGLHMQLGESAQAKLVGVLSGRVYDVAVDLRQDSPTRGQSFGILLDAEEDPRFFYIPRGFAHGFLVLSEEAEVYYKVDNYYDKNAEAGIKYNDPTLNINWPEIDVPKLLSVKDQRLESYNFFINEYGGSL